MGKGTDTMKVKCGIKKWWAGRTQRKWGIRENPHGLEGKGKEEEEIL